MANVALLATIADAKASQATQTVSPVMPAGVILPYGGNTAPAGWLVCDGAEYSQTTYADLFAALGSTYNTQLNPVTGSNWAAPSGGNFRVPDMRGMFLRGEGTPSGLDAVSVGGSQVDKTKKNGLAATSSPTLTFNNQNLNHSHTADHDHSNASGSGSFSGDSSTKGGNNGVARTLAIGDDTDYGTYIPSGTVSVSVDLPNISVTTSASLTSTYQPSVSSNTVATTVGAGDNETRPINRGVKYIIKV